MGKEEGRKRIVETRIERRVGKDMDEEQSEES